MSEGCHSVVYPYPAPVSSPPHKKALPLAVLSRVCVCSQLCLTLQALLDCSRPGSSVHGISQARILEQVAIVLSRGSSRGQIHSLVSSALAGRFFATSSVSEINSQCVFGKWRIPQGNTSRDGLPSAWMSSCVT